MARPWPRAMRLTRLVFAWTVKVRAQRHVMIPTAITGLKSTVTLARSLSQCMAVIAQAAHRVIQVAAAQRRVWTTRVLDTRVIIGWKAMGIAVPYLNLSTVVTAVAVIAVARLQEAVRPRAKRAKRCITLLYTISTTRRRGGRSRTVLNSHGGRKRIALTFTTMEDEGFPMIPSTTTLTGRSTTQTLILHTTRALRGGWRSTMELGAFGFVPCLRTTPKRARIFILAKTKTLTPSTCSGNLRGGMSTTLNIPRLPTAAFRITLSASARHFLRQNPRRPRPRLLPASATP
mmetsp:Transcript_9405/g.23776  ORF Transcript_9405/g.23776 Transcript_9405/m.23776 type:complete len:289 (-) Transcript_9405:3042-3908(-)